MTEAEIDAMPWAKWRNYKSFADGRLGIASDDGEDWGDDG